MPELPDIEIYRKYCQKNIIDKPIKDIMVVNDKIFETQEPYLEKHLTGKTFEKVERHGKYIFIKVKNDGEIVIHFGMTGNVAYFKRSQPKYSRFIVEFRNGYKFSVVSVRQLGEISFTKDRDAFLKEKDIGPDAQSLSKKDFVNIFRDKRGSVKSALTNQSYMSGIGNIYSDEILYQSDILPSSNIHNFKPKHLKKLYNVMRRVLKVSVDHNADYKNLPKRYLIRRRQEGRKCGICSGRIKKTKINSRSTYYCSKHQENIN